MSKMTLRNTFYPSTLNLIISTYHSLKSCKVSDLGLLRNVFLWIVCFQSWPLNEVSRMFYNDLAHHKPFEIFHHNMFWTWPKRIMWTIASTLNRTKNYCFRLLSLIADNNATQNSQPTGKKNELISTVLIPAVLIDRLSCTYASSFSIPEIFFKRVLD